jgi:hypothetical protein
MDQKRRTLAEGKSVVISKFEKNSSPRILKSNFLCQKIKIFKKSYKNHFWNENNLSSLVIIFVQYL